MTTTEAEVCQVCDIKDATIPPSNPAWCSVCFEKEAEEYAAEYAAYQKKRRHVRMFKPQFAALVAAGKKTCTMRPVPKREIRKGDIIDCRAWEGKAYRSKQRRIRCEYVTEVQAVSIGHGPHNDGFSIDGVEQDTERRARMARADGFVNFTAMLDFFKAEHGLPFTGVLIEWGPVFPG